MDASAAFRRSARVGDLLLRIASWNIHKGIGGIDRRYRLDRTIEVLKRIDADLCLLQEVDEGVPRSRHDRQVDVIGDALAMEWRAFAANHRLKVGHYGNALLSRVPFRAPHNLSLNLPLHKRRSALHVRVTLPELPHGLWVFNCHLGLAEAERRRQLQRVLRCIDEHHGSEETVAIMGDLNDVWGRIGPALLSPAGFVTVARPAKTFPAIRPLRPLDRLFVRGRVTIVRCERFDSTLARHASDHLPIVAELSIHGAE